MSESFCAAVRGGMTSGGPSAGRGRGASSRRRAKTLSVEILDVEGLEVTVTRKAVKNMYLRIKPPDGRVEITAPKRLSRASIARFVHSRREWIEATRRNVIESDSRSPLKQPWSDERKREAKRILNERISQMLLYWVPIVGKVPTNISLRRMSTRWGSCTPATGRIRINLELAFLPEAYLEYVLVHELTHLWERGHGEGFQRRMTSYLPEWKRLRRELNQMV
nr:SprT family zinc-dependent metalloprotease [Bifidobacterium catulorum]